MFENFCLEIIETLKYFALEKFNLSCQAEHTKMNSRFNFNPGLSANRPLNNSAQWLSGSALNMVELMRADWTDCSWRGPEG